MLELQTQVKYRLQDLSGAVSYDGDPISANDIVVNEPGSAIGWTAALLRGLWAVASRDNAPSDYLHSIEVDAIGSNITAQTLAVAIWVAENTLVPGAGSPTDIGIPTGAVLPNFSLAPPVPPGEASVGFDCHLIATGPVTPVQNRQVIPFQFNAWAVLGVLAAGLVATAVFVKDVPVTKRSNRSGKN